LFSSSIFDGHAHSHASYVYLRGNIFYILFIDSEKIATRAFYELSPENKVAHNVEMIFNDKLISLVKAYKASPAIDTRNKIFEEVYEVYGDIHAAADRIVASGERNHFLYKDKTALVLQYLLDELNITQISLARNAGVTGSLIFRLLNPKSSNGIKIPTDDHLASIAKYFRITIDQLRGMEDFTFVKHASVERELDARRRKYTTYADSMIKGVSGTGKFSPIFDIMRIITDEKTTVSTLKQIYGISKYLYEKQNEEDNDS
jgi:transcriptional regulator with XRE-family HTH domain